VSIDKTLKSRRGMSSDRNVLTRAERIAKLTEDDRFKDGKTSPLGLPKVRVEKAVTGKKKKKAKDEEEETEEK